jgi:hypothetical protein
VEPTTTNLLERKEIAMDDAIAENNKAIVLEAFDTLFNNERLYRSGALVVAQLHLAQFAD